MVIDGKLMEEFPFDWSIVVQITVVLLFYFFKNIQTDLTVPKFFSATRDELLNFCFHPVQQRGREPYSVFWLSNTNLCHSSQCFMRSSLLAVAVLVLSAS